jgi:cytochrome c5
MTMTSKLRMLTIVALLSTPLYSQNATLKASLPPVAGNKQPATTPAPLPHANDRQQIFDQQCSRCHNAPEGFSPRISGTIIRHMRVRASLSQHEEAELLRFLNP